MVKQYLDIHSQICRQIENLPALPSKEMTVRLIDLERLRDQIYDRYQYHSPIEEKNEPIPAELI